MSIIKSFFSVLLLLLILSGTVFSQTGTGIISVYDVKTGNPIPFAHVIFKGISKTDNRCITTNDEGKVENIAKSKIPFIITCIGFKDYLDTISVGQDLRVEMYPTIFDVDEVVVTGQFKPQRIDKSIYKISVINSKQIENKAATNLAELMQGEVNFRVTTDAFLGSALTIQGLSGNNVKILVDGVPVIGRMGGDVDLSQLNLSMVDHIEIVEGPMSVIYGSNSLAGAINIITKENTRNSVNTSVDTYYESVGVYDFNALASIKKDKHTISANIGRNFFGGFDLYNNSRSTKWKPKEQYNAEGYYIFKDEKQKVKIQNTYMRELVLDRGEPYFYGERALDTYFYSFRNTTKGQYNRSLFKNHYLELVGAWSYFSRVKRTYNKDLTTLSEALTIYPSDHDTSKFKSTMIRGTFSRQEDAGKLNYQLGFDINLDKGYGKRLENNEQGIEDYAMFLSINHKHNEKFSFQPGLRLIYNSRYKAPLVPSLNIKLRLFKGLDLRASYARGFRSPTLKELYHNFIDFNHFIVGNDNLKAENGNNFNLALTLNTETLKKLHFSNFKVDFFFNDINDNIYFAEKVDPELNQTIYTYLNVHNFKSLGGTFKFEYKFYPYLFFSAGYGNTGTYIKTKDEEFVFSDFVFSSDFSSDLRYSLIRYNLDLLVYYKFNGRFNRLYIDSNDDVQLSYMNGFNNLDLSVLKRLWNDRISLSFGVKNVFDNTEIESMDFGSVAHSDSGSGESMVAWGRTFFVKFNMNFSKF